jgi:hypothetical protein
MSEWDERMKGKVWKERMWSIECKLRCLFSTAATHLLILVLLPSAILPRYILIGGLSFHLVLFPLPGLVLCICALSISRL